jgi:sugar phosphate isomerase/epimerase
MIYSFYKVLVVIFMKISVQTGDVVDELGFEKGYELIKKAGFQAVDWNLDHAWKPADVRKGIYGGNCIFEKPLAEVIEHYNDELEIIKKNKLKIAQAHAPFPCWVREHPAFLDYAIEAYKRNIEYCDYAGCPFLVIHGVSYSFADEVNTPEDIYALNKKLYTSLIPTLLENNVTVCLENLFVSYNSVNYQGCCSDASKAAEFIDMLNDLAGSEVFGLCLDTGHANLLHHDFRVIIPQYGKRIKCLHIHDNNGSKDQHRAPGTGTINWDFFCTALREAGYEGDLSFETFSQTNAASKLDKSLILPWLRLICETGKLFRNKIIG